MRTPAWLESVRHSRKNGGNGGVVKNGDKLPPEWVANLSKSKLGRKNPMYGRCGEKHHNSKKVLDESSGQIYPSVTAAAKSIRMRMQTLHNMLTGFRKNWTSMRLVNNGMPIHS